jgi:Uma2 family endonuclease
MATEIQTAIPTTSGAPGPDPGGKSGLVPYRLTVRQFEKMIIGGIFRDEDRVELLAGLLIKKMTTYDPHDFAVDQLGDNLGRILPGDWITRQEKSVVLGRYWRPQPDITVARGPRTRYRSKAPSVADLGMLMEVADSTYAKDRGLKWGKYADCRVSVYWIVNIRERRIEVYSSPSGRGKAAHYRERKDYGPDEEVPVVIQGQEVGRIKVSEIV